MSDDDTFTGTIPDLHRKLREDHDDWDAHRMWVMEMLKQHAEAGRALEDQMRTTASARAVGECVTRIAALERDLASRRGMAKMLDWLIKLGGPLVGYFAGRHTGHQ